MGKIPAADPMTSDCYAVRYLRPARTRLAVLLLVGVVAGCDEGPSPMRLSVIQVESPAGQDSGQPFVSSAGDDVYLSWFGRADDGARRLQFATYASGAWGPPVTISDEPSFLVNVSDFPSIVAGDGGLWVHWLVRDGEGFGYGVRVAGSSDRGATWSEPWTPHDDATSTEHGFVSLLPLGSEVGVLWLDGRGFAEGAGGGDPPMQTALYFRTGDRAGPSSPEVPLDVRVCDCCQTDVAVTSEGAVFVYRDRSPEEIRDIRLLRFDGQTWSDEGWVHEDGWETGACPVNGPAVAARDRRVAVAWFTAADGDARVQVAFSDDGGRRFGSAIRVDDGAPAGRTDVVLLRDGSALVSWVERTGGEGADVRLRRVDPGGALLESVAATAGASERAVGFPRLAAAGDGAILVAWTDGSELTPRVRLTRIELEDS